MTSHDRIGPLPIYHELVGTANEGSRPLGMINPELMGEAASDPATVTVTLPQGEVPALVPIEYAHGYDTARCHDIVGEQDKGNVLYFSLPAWVGSTALDAELGTKLASRQFGYVFYDVTGVNETPPLLRKALDHSGHPYLEVPLLDDKASEDNQQASISLYGMDLPAEYPEKRVENPTIPEWYDNYMAGVTAGKYTYDPENGAILIKGDDISDELLEAMWEVYLDRFQWLGEKHPVSMEDSKEDFARVLRDSNTMASVYFQEGKPKCFTYFCNGTDQLYWLDRDFLNDKTKMRMNDAQSVLFFPGIVASESGSGYSAHVIGLITQTIFDNNAEYKIIFENTNRSEKYIPKLVQLIVNKQHRVQVQLPELLDRTIYGCVQFGEPPTPVAQ